LPTARIQIASSEEIKGKGKGKGKGEEEIRSIRFELDFLEDFNYQAVLISDGTSERDLQSESFDISKVETKVIQMIGRGGFVIHSRKR
jgi:hypothetical protein